MYCGELRIGMYIVDTLFPSRGIGIVVSIKNQFSFNCRVLIRFPYYRDFVQIYIFNNLFFLDKITPMKPIKSNQADLRICASCEWIFRLSDTDDQTCPKCGFGHYGARYVYGDKVYKYKINQKPWLDKKMFQYKSKLLDEIKESSFFD